MKITVLAGGLSMERDVSLTSGSLIANALIRRGYEVALVDLYRGIDEGTDPSSLFGTEPFPQYKVDTTAPDLDALVASCGGRTAPIGPGVLDLCRAADAVFVALHGGVGENGELQAALDCAGIRRYTGTGYLGAALSMDKQISKELMKNAGVPVPEGIYFDAEDENSCADILAEVGLPCVIKPSTNGSSVGVSRIFNPLELGEAIRAASKFDRFLLAEKLIVGRELTCAILDGEALPPVEIIPNHGWYDYQNKYQKGATTEVCPAEIGDDLSVEISELALRAFGALRLEMYGRADFILDKENKLWCLEVNALPGMTPTSLLPQEAAAVGIDYEELCDMLVKMAMEK